MAHTYHSDTFSESLGSSSYHTSNQSSISHPKENSAVTEKQEDMIIKHITSQLNSSINRNLGYEHYPAAPHDFSNHSLTNVTKFGYNDLSGK